MYSQYHYIFYFVGVATLVCLYGAYKCIWLKDDYLAKNIMGIDGWALSHFITFAIAGVLFPDSFFATLCIGILWEILEYTFQNTHNKFTTWTSQCDYGKYWYGRPVDIIYNVLGFLFGKCILLKYYG